MTELIVVSQPADLARQAVVRGEVVTFTVTAQPHESRLETELSFYAIGAAKG